MRKIKTITAGTAEDFDRRVNEAIAEGWTLIKRDVLAPFSGPTGYWERRFYAELERDDEAAKMFTPMDWGESSGESERDEPLTLDELAQMKSEPVWVQSPGVPEYGRWAIVEGVSTDGGDKILFLHDDFTCHEYGDVWLAYRHKQNAVPQN